MTTRNLLRGPITLSAAKSQSRNILHELLYEPQKRAFYKRIDSYGCMLADVVAHHLGTTPEKINVSPEDYWRHGSFNLCIPIMIDNSTNPTLPQFVMIRFPLPYRVGEATFPGNSDEKISCEAATYAWIRENCPEVPIPQLYGFGLTTKQRFTRLDLLPWWSRWYQRAQRYIMTALGVGYPSQYIPHQTAHCLDLDLGYLLIETITAGTMLSESWDEKCKDSRLLDNLQQDLAKLTLSLASVPLSRIGTFRLDAGGYLKLDNRPLSVQDTVQENEGIPVSDSTYRTFSRVDDFLVHHLEAFDNRLIHQPNAISSSEDAWRQMTSLFAAKVIFPQLFQRELNNGPFAFALTDLHRSNILVDENWHITHIIDLEFACSLPLEFITVPYWLSGAAADEISPVSYAPYYEVFVGHIKREEGTRKQRKGLGSYPLSSIMERSWTSGAFWVTLAVTDPIGFTGMFYDHILPKFYSFPSEELNDADYKRFGCLWRPDSSDVVQQKLQDRDEYSEKLDEFFVDSTWTTLGTLLDPMP